MKEEKFGGGREIGKQEELREGDSESGGRVQEFE